MILIRLLLFGGALFLIYKLFEYIIKEWRKADINEEIDEKKEVMAETIIAAQKVDKDEIKAFEKAKKKLEEI
jgi:hypothetical protein